MPRMLDHLVLTARDLGRIRESYLALGFTLTPRAQHPFGTCNHLAQLQGNFLELVAVADPAQIPPMAPGRFSFGAFNQAFLTRREGLSMLVFASGDSRADAEGFAARGLETYEPFEFGRDAILPDGSRVRVAFSLAFVTNRAMPEAAFFTCQQHHAPQFFWKPEYQRHPNGAERVVEVVMSAPDPAAHRDFFERLTEGPAGPSVGASAGTLAVGGARDRITLLAPDRLARRFPELPPRGAGDAPRFEAYRVRVADLDAAARLLARNRVPHRRAGAVLVVPPAAAHGVAVEFTAGDAAGAAAGAAAES